MNNGKLNFRAISITKSEDDNCFIPMNKGWMLTPEQTEILIEGLKEYAKHSKEINEFNSEHEKEIKKYQEEVITSPINGISKKNERKIVEGYVYIVKFDNHFKIGKTKYMKGRMGEYTKLPIEPEIIFLKKVDDCTTAEECLHDYFADKRGRGEWFDLTDEDIKKAKQLV